MEPKYKFESTNLCQCFICREKRTRLKKTRRQYRRELKEDIKMDLDLILKTWAKQVGELKEEKT